jgi:hypothetical protein
LDENNTKALIYDWNRTAVQKSEKQITVDGQNEPIPGLKDED